MKMNIINEARRFAIAAHRAINHKRKYSGECYTVHLAEVAKLVWEHGGTNDMVAAAWLHDVVEDTGVTIYDVADEFGNEVATLVEWVTDVSKPEDGNRKTRKAMDRDHLAKGPPDAQTIKLCDIISNTSSITENDPEFAKVYLKEKAELLAVMTKGEPRLYERAKAIIYPSVAA